MNMGPPWETLQAAARGPFDICSLLRRGSASASTWTILPGQNPRLSCEPDRPRSRTAAGHLPPKNRCRAPGHFHRSIKHLATASSTGRPFYSASKRACRHISEDWRWPLAPRSVPRHQTCDSFYVERRWRNRAFAVHGHGRIAPSTSSLPVFFRRRPGRMTYPKNVWPRLAWLAELFFGPPLKIWFTSAALTAAQITPESRPLWIAMESRMAHHSDGVNPSRRRHEEPSHSGDV